MSYNGSGTFLINTAGQPVVSGTVISSTAFNALTADLATGLSTAITKDGQTTVTANIPMGTYKFTGLGTGSAATDSANLSQVQSTAVKLLASVSGADTITAVGSPTVGAYAAGQMFYFVAAGDNTGAVTLNIDSLGAKAVTRDGSTALVAGDIKSGELCVVVYDGTRFQLINASNSFGDLNVTGTLTLSGGTANGVLYLNGSKVATSGSALVFDGTNLGIGTASPAQKLDVTGTVNSVQARFGNVAGRGLTISTTTITGTNDAGVIFNAPTSSDGTLIFQTQSVERLRITATGLGISEGNDPTQALSLYRAGSTNAIMSAGNSNTGLDGTWFGVDTAGNGIVNVRGAFPLLFSTNTTERARISSGGELLVGTTSVLAGERLHVKGAGSTSATYNCYFENSGGSRVFSFEDAGKFTTGTLADSPYNLVVGATNRDLFVDNAGAIGYVSSVRASKTNITPVSDTDWLLQLNPVTFNFRKKDADGNYTDEADGPVKHGLIAEEVETVNSDLCFYDDEDKGGALRGVNYSHLITPMLKLIQKQQAAIAALEAKVAALESK